MRDTLAPYLAEKACFLHARLIGTPGHKGGVVTFARFANDARILLKQSSYTMLSSMFIIFVWIGNERYPTCSRQRKRVVTTGD